MKTQHLPALLLVALIAAAQPACADGAVPANASIASALSANVGKSVTVRLSAGEELTGVLRAVNDTALVLGQLSGREFFDAVIALHAVQAVIVRTH